MDTDIDLYRQLARHLDRLPGGYPATESGVELRILRRLFNPQDAALALHLTLLPEEARVIAHRAILPIQEVKQRLEDMASRGLIYSLHHKDRPPEYMAMQYVIGVWEFQVNRLDEDLVRDMDEYIDTLFNADLWRRAPQLRTIPIVESISYPNEVLAYEQAREIVRKQDKILLADCICRKEQHLVGKGCDKPLETCLIFGGGAKFYERYDMGRTISVDEALAVLDLADSAGLVLQPTNAQEASGICCCCGDCCGVLRTINRYPRPADLISTPFYAQVDADLCAACGVCETRCQMEAISLEDGVCMIKTERCIGCGLCVTTCVTHALSLQRKAEPPTVPRTYVDATLQLGRERGVLKMKDLAAMMVKSKADRLLAAREQEGK
jgi:Fe-S-cluster-containing hydrogenase component 2/predicted transcriptional regulator